VKLLSWLVTRCVKPALIFSIIFILSYAALFLVLGRYGDSESWLQVLRTLFAYLPPVAVVLFFALRFREFKATLQTSTKSSSTLVDVRTPRKKGWKNKKVVRVDFFSRNRPINMGEARCLVISCYLPNSLPRPN
jgi:hypothetical protein